MALPTTRTEFKNYILRKLGQGAIDVNVTIDQVDDRVDEALEHFSEYHDEGTERVLIDYQISSINITNRYVTMPDDIIGVTGFVESPNSASSFFDVEYQYMLSNVHEIASANMRYFYVAMMHLDSIEQMFDWHTSIRYNRVTNKIYIDEDWNKFSAGDYFIFYAYRVVDSDINSRIWSNKWLRDYTANLVKKQWGENLAKYEGVQMIGGVQFNAQRLIDEANQELEQLETQVKETESIPMGIFIG